MSDASTLAAASNPTQSIVGGGLSAAGRALPASLLVALPGLVVLAGFDNLAFGLGLLAGVVLAGLLIAPRVAKEGVATITGALHRRFGRAAAILAGIVVVLVVLPLLAADFVTVATVAQSAFGSPYLAAVLAALTVAAIASVAFGERAFGYAAAAVYFAFAASIVLLLVMMAAKSAGRLAPELAYGSALTAVGELEERLLENQLVDFETFSVHVTPFLRLSQRDVAALVFALALGTAVLPQLVSALTFGRRPAATRLAGAWTALFVMIVLIAAPALAAYAKLEIYGAIAKGTPLSALPSWLEAPLGAGLAQIHGTSIAMLKEVASAVRGGAADPSAIGDQLAIHALAIEQSWRTLDESVKLAVIEAAKSLSANATSDEVWRAYTGSVLPAAASAAGNEAGILSQAALVLDPAGLLLALPELASAPSWLALAMAVGVISVGVVMAAAFMRSLMSLSGEHAAAKTKWASAGLALVIALLAAGFATLRPGELVTICVSALSLAAAGLFPALGLGLAWKRATAAGAIAAIVVGAGVTLYYDIGIQVFPAAFYKTWQGFSDAGEMAIEEFNAGEEAVVSAEDADAKATALIALDDLARGTPTRHGLANWAGIDSASGAVFGAPVGILTLILVSLMTRRRQRAE
ncbi:sodium:solute symporter family transporter [Hyphomicrobium sp.]|uniref:sodium:solute symporter family transporter n=1 Tax=Hyphomicrobium sp. TaxID=82 RepID=UPI002E2F1BCB|nr:hypothetical protein [Hyphomicrobium sp.]HEX2840256.1 hypothetical protein [Hyphomicrobium sp.]